MRFLFLLLLLSWYLSHAKRFDFAKILEIVVLIKLMPILIEQLKSRGLRGER